MSSAHRTQEARPLAVGAWSILVGAFGFLLYGGIDKNVVYFLTPNELLATRNDGVRRPGATWRTGAARVSVKWDADTLDLRFVVTDGRWTVGDRARSGRAAADVPRRHGRGGRRPVPTQSGVFESHNLMVKHSNEYRAPKPGESPQEMYKTLMKGAGS